MRRIYLFALLAALALTLAACEGIGGSGDDNTADLGDDPPAFNLTGRFRPQPDSEPCRDTFGNTVNLSPTDVEMTQTGSSLRAVVTRSGHTHTGRIAGDGFFLQSHISALGGSCDYEFSGTVFSDDEFTGVEMIDCSDDSHVICAGTHMKRVQ